MIREYLDDVVAELGKHGIVAHIDPLMLTPPCAWVNAKRIIGQRLDGTYIVEVGVHLIVPELDIPIALAKLETMLHQALAAVPGIVTDTDLGTTVTLPSGSVCPSFALTVEQPS